MPGPQMGAPGIAFRGSEDLAQKKQQQQQKKKKTITVICTDPDATDSSGDEACGSVAVPAFKKKKRLVREIFLPLAVATASSVTENRPSFSPSSSSSSSSCSSPASILGASKQAAVMKPSRRQTKPLRRSGKPRAAYRRGKCLPPEMEMPSAGESLESSAVFDRFSSEDDDAALLAFVSDIVPDDDVGNSHILHDSLPPSSSSSFSSSSSSSSTEFFSPTGLISSQKPMDIGLSMFEEGYCGPLAAELSQILDHMMIPTQELNRKLPDFVFDIFDPNNGAGGDLSDLNFDLDCESMAWVNIPEGCIV